MRVKFAGILSFFVCICSTAAFAEESDAGVLSAPPCELHVWPGGALRSTYHGWFHGGIVDGAIKGRDGYQSLPTEPLSTNRQLEQLRQIPLAEVVGLPGYTVVIHETALASHELRSTPGRLASKSTPCYAELAIDDAFFQEDIVNGRFIKVLYRFRQFDTADIPVRSFGAYTQEKLLLFPPKAPNEQIQPALEELGTAFAMTVRKFGAALTKPSKEKLKGKS